jgi:murein L,D-transpeptidase YcbB/YkuD
LPANSAVEQVSRMILFFRPEPQGGRRRFRGPSVLFFVTPPRQWLIAAVIFACVLGPGAAGLAAAAEPERFGPLMRVKITAAQAENRMICRGELVCGIAELPRFYAQREYRPAWSDGGGSFASAEDLLRSIEEAREDGLDPHAYHLETIRPLLAKARLDHDAGRPPEPALIVDLDFLLTDAFLLLGSHLRAGRVNPETFYTEWVVRMDPEVDFAGALQRALESGRIGEALDGFRPPHPEYNALKTGLKSYRRLGPADEWPRLPEKASWDRGQTGELADLLRERLRLSGDLVPASGGEGADAERELFEGLRRFQARHGLEADGRMGPQTLQALNASLPERIRQIELNMERWRWLPRDLGARHIRVNVPAFDLAVVEENQAVMRMRVVAGRHYRRTPVFSSRMDHLVLNPDWNIPTRIAVEDILPKARKDPGYLTREKIRVFESWGRDAAELDPGGIDWTGVTAGNFRYRLKKDPGVHNDLGRIKFLFPNKFDVYLHDTPSKRLFERSMRGFSSGCIRIEKPLDLAAYVLTDSPGWSREAVSAAIDTGQLRTIGLTRKIPVHLIYMTAGADAEGRVLFWQDIYQRDPVLERALKEKPPRFQ